MATTFVSPQHPHALSEKVRFHDLGKSRFKRAHKTHAFNQRAGDPYPSRGQDETGASGMRSEDAASILFAKLTERVPDPAARAALIGVPTTLDEAWRRGEQLPVLRAHRRRLQRALRASEGRGAADGSA